MSAVLPIEEDDRFEIYTASSGQKTFAVPFAFQDNADVGVYYLSAASWIKIAAANYVMTGAGEAAGGSFTLMTGRAGGEKVLVIGEAIITRITSIVRAGKFSSAATDNDLDRAVIIAQEQNRELARTLRMVRTASIAFEVADDVAEGEVLIRSGNQLIGASLAAVADATEGAAIVVALALKADLSYVNAQLLLKQDANDAVTLDDTQTLTHKTLTAPVITNPTGVVATAAQTLTTTEQAQVRTNIGANAALTPRSAHGGGTSKDFALQLAKPRQIVLTIDAMSTNGSAAIMLRLATSAGFVTTGYASGLLIASSSAAAASASGTTGFRIASPASAAALMYGEIVLTLMDEATNTWSIRGSISDNGGTRAYIISGGVVSLPGPLTSLKILSEGSDVFDAGYFALLERP